MSPIMARSAGFFFAALLILLAATAPASGACTMSVADSESISNPNGIFILNGIGYVASTDYNGKLFVMPVNPITSGSSYDVFNPAYDVSVSGSNAYITEGSSGVEVVNAANGQHAGWCTGWDSNLFAIGIYISGNYAYVGAAGGTTGGCLVVLSLANPNSPSVAKTISCGSMNSGGGGLCVTDDKIYLATDNTIDVFSISTPGNPVYDSQLPIAGAYDVHVYGGKIYVVAPSSSPSVTVRDLSNPTVVQDCYNAGSPYAIQFYEGYIYIVGPDNGLEKLNVGSVSGSLTVNLDAIPNSAQDFSFLGDLGPFTLDDDSGADGTYSNTKIFSSLATGYYAFHQTVPSGWIVSSITASNASKVTYSSDGNSWHSTFTSGDTWAKVSVQAGGSLTVSFQDTRAYSISGHVIYDLDGNGAKNNFEGYVPDGWVVQLWKDGTQTSQTTTLSGAYSFSNLPAGNYEVRSILQTGWVNTLPASGIRSYSPLSSDQTNQDFGVRGSQSIAGMKFHDLDGDRAKDAGEPGLASWTIDLKKDGTKIASTQTAAGGAYSFAGLAPGSYIVEETLQSGWTQSYPASPGTHAVTLVAGVAGPTDRDFGNYQPTGFSGVKFEDSNGNGTKDAGETGISGWTIKLKQGTTEIASIQTGTGGAYSFNGIAPGSYTVEEVAQSGWTRSYPASPGTHTITLASGFAGPTDINFGNWRSTGFSGMKFEDLNGNGAKDADEPGLSGWTIKLKQGATEIDSIQTGTGGAYSFTGLAPGSYTVEEVAQSGWTQSYPATPGTQTVTLASGVAGPTDINFGNWRTTGFSGMKFEDLDGNGTRDAGEPGLKDWTIKLMSGATEIGSTQTDAGGAYSFTDVAPGTYTVKEASQAGWAQTYPALPGTHTINLVSGVAGSTNINFGNARATGFSGMKFEDLNGNGVKDLGEPGLKDRTIKLMSGATEIFSTQTAADGRYSFIGIAPGSYTVQEVAQAGWTQSYPASPGTHIITLASGVAGPTDIDFGNWKSTGFSGMKFEDLNGNGAKDAGEPGLKDWTIKLMSGSTELGSTQTGTDGAYSFSGIAPGSYTVQEVAQAGWTQSYPTSPGTHAITLVSGVAGPMDLDFGNWKSTGFSGQKFEDLNGNGDKDAGEPGLADWTIRLMKGATVVASALTLADGAYSFTGIAPGSYTVQEVAQAGWTQSYPASPGTQTVNLVSGAAGPTDIDFGNWRATGFSGMKFNDLDRNGARDAGEPGLSGWTIKLMKGATEISSTQTAADGSYSFTDIAPGSYTVEEAAQSGWVQSYPATPGMHPITLVSGIAGPTDIDFGNRGSLAISGMKFHDKNANGVMDDGEPCLSGWDIQLKDESDNLLQTTTTSSDPGKEGVYEFIDLQPDTYRVYEVQKNGWVRTAPAGEYHTVTLTNMPSRGNMFGNNQVKISGIKFEDLNGNGAKDTGDPGILGWEIQLKKEGAEVDSTVTAADGSYSFAGIAPGSYTVEEAAQAGWTQSYPLSGTQTFSLASGESGRSGLDFGNFRPTGFAGTKFEDLNGNGAKDSGEPGLSGWTIRLMKEGAQVASTVTTADGSYSFTGISPGSYTVEETAQSGWTQSYPVSVTYAITLVSGVAGPTDRDFGNYWSTDLSGMKFEDLNGNGAKDSGEPGLPGWTIRLMKEGIEVASTVTAADGSYSFTSIVPGEYTVEEVLQSGWLQTYPAAPGTYAVILVSGVAGRTDLDFGNWKTTGLSGMKFEDLNANGAKDSGEPGLSGWTVRLMNGANEVGSTVTAADGSYSFAGVVADSYTVEEVAQAGWTQSYPASGTHAITLVSGFDGPKDVDFGNWRKTGLSGMKFDDINGNGVKDSGEPGLEGWAIRLMKEGALVAWKKTVADGSYSFADIVPGSYTVEEVAQDGWLQTCPASPGIYSLNLLSGIAASNIDFGNFKAGGFAGIKFEDKNGNGVRDSGEPGLAGWTISLKKDGTVVASTQTAADGAYYFADIAPGSYTVEETAQDGWTQTCPTDDIYTAVSSSGQVKITRADQSEIPATEANFGNRKLVEAFRVEIVADHQTVLPGESLVFTITINRVGDILLDSMSVQYTLPNGLKFVSANPSPQSIIENLDGSTTLIWTDLSFISQIAAQLASLQSVSASPTDALAPSTTITVTSEVLSDAPQTLTGKVEVEGSTVEAEVAKDEDTVTVNVPSQHIYLNKTSDLKEVWPGATIGYTITYENLVNIPLTQVTITEQASSDLIFLSASPAPDQDTDNVWSIGDLAPREKGTINVFFQVKNTTNLSFLSQSSVSGSGFVSSYRRLSTETESQGLRNSVTLTCKEFTPVSTSYFVKLRDSDGTSLLKTEHGSGDYRSEEVAALKMQNRSISTAGSLKAVYRPTSFSLLGGKSINYSSEIASSTQIRNRATQASTSQEIRYAKSLEMDQKLLVDKNETLLSVEGSMQGQAHLGVLKKDGHAVKPTPVFESSQDYAGTFRFNQSLEDYGSNVLLIRNASGLGQAASDLRLKKSQRSYEHGNGSYESEEQASTAESYLAKDLSVSSDPQYGYGKWKSGIWSKSSGKSYLGQEVSSADYIKEETKASGLNDLSSNLSYRGQGRFRAVSEPDNRSMMDLDEEYVGEYTIQRKVHLGGVSHFDRPHITLNKIGKLVPGTVVADYTINVLNDGNTAMGPVYVWDIFPAGTDYLTSSLKPNRLQPGYANWSLLYLGIGQSVTISLRLNLTDPQDELVNLVYASGGHNDEWVTAGNMSVMQFGWLGCCQPDLLLEKQAKIDAVDGRTIWYRILLQNRANVSLAAQVTDRLPGGLQLLNASAQPQVEGQELVWVTGAIPAGQSRFIEYRAQATQNGRFVNIALAEVHALDGSGGGMAKASATVTVGEATSYTEDGWRPPEWGLDRMEMICDDEIAGEWW